MPNFQFFGTLPTKEGATARAVERGARGFASGFIGGREEELKRREQQAGRAQQESQFTRQFGLQQQQLESQKAFQNEQLQASIRRQNFESDKFSALNTFRSQQEVNTAQYRKEGLDLQRDIMENEEEFRTTEGKRKAKEQADKMLLGWAKIEVTTFLALAKNSTKDQGAAINRILRQFNAGRLEEFLGSDIGKAFLLDSGTEYKDWERLVQAERGRKGLKTPPPLSQAEFKQANELLRARAAEKADIGRGFLGRAFTGTGTERAAATRGLEDEQLRRQKLLGEGGQFGAQRFGAAPPPTSTLSPELSAFLNSLPKKTQQHLTSPVVTEAIMVAVGVGKDAKEAQKLLESMGIPWKKIHELMRKQ